MLITLKPCKLIICCYVLCASGMIKYVGKIFLWNSRWLLSITAKIFFWEGWGWWRDFFSALYIWRQKTKVNWTTAIIWKKMSTEMCVRLWNWKSWLTTRINNESERMPCSRIDTCWQYLTENRRWSVTRHYLQRDATSQVLLQANKPVLHW